MSPTRRFQPLVAVLAAGACLGLTAAGLVLHWLTRSTDVPTDFGSRSSAAFTALLFVSLPVLGAFIARRRPEVVLAWAFIAIGATMALWVLADGYAVYTLLTQPGVAPGGETSAWLANWIWIPGWGLTAVLLLAFPDGRLPSRRARHVAWAVAGTTVSFAVATMVVKGGLANYTFVENPLGFLAIAPDVLKLVGGLALLGLGVVVLGFMLPRARRAHGDEQAQFRWVGYAATVVVGTTALSWTLVALDARILLVENAALAIPALLPMSAGVAVLRYRLYDIELVINKTFVYASLATFVTVVYVAIVVGLGQALGGRGQPDLGLPITATVVVALAFDPARRRFQTVADRLVYGQRGEPDEVLADFSQRMGELAGTDDLLVEMARLLGQATGAAEAVVWLRTGPEMRPVASWPKNSHPGVAVPVTGDAVPSLAGTDLAMPVHHLGELLGALSVRSRPGDSVRPREAKLAAGLASQAGHVLRNVRLTEELVARLNDLRASRQRLVSAQDEERRRLERNLHDGAQQYLVALKVQLGLASTLLEEGSDDVASLLRELQVVAAEGLEEVRALAHGVYPPLLADRGLAAALEAQGNRLPLEVRVLGNGLRRYPEETEAAAYFCCSEALQNTAKYAEASVVCVDLTEEGDSLVFRVSDDGKGFDPAFVPRGNGQQNMADRLEALGGGLEVRSTPGQGTTVVGRVPATACP